MRKNKKPVGKVMLYNKLYNFTHSDAGDVIILLKGIEDLQAFQTWHRALSNNNRNKNVCKDVEIFLNKGGQGKLVDCTPHIDEERLEVRISHGSYVGNVSLYSSTINHIKKMEKSKIDGKVLLYEKAYPFAPSLLLENNSGEIVVSLKTPHDLATFRHWKKEVELKRFKTEVVKTMQVLFNGKYGVLKGCLPSISEDESTVTITYDLFERTYEHDGEPEAQELGAPPIDKLETPIGRLISLLELKSQTAMVLSDVVKLAETILPYEHQCITGAYEDGRMGGIRNEGDNRDYFGSKYKSRGTVTQMTLIEKAIEYAKENRYGIFLTNDAKVKLAQSFTHERHVVFRSEDADSAEEIAFVIKNNNMYLLTEFNQDND